MSPKKILIIDDDIELNEELAENLEAEGYSIDVAADAQRGRQLIRDNIYDVFLLDFKMQDVTGIELFKEIRKKDRKAAIFLVSGRPGLKALVEAEHLSDEMDGIIEKPFDLQFLLEKLKSC